MMARRLTIRQREVILDVADHWGKVFTLPWNYQFMVAHKLVREATKEDEEEHYAFVLSELEKKHAQLTHLVQERRYQRLVDTARRCASMVRELETREEDRKYLMTFSAEGLAFVAKLKAAQAAQILKGEN